MAVSQDFMTWTPGPRLHGPFLLHVLRGMRPRLLGLMYGSTHKTIYMPDLLALRTPLPEVARQRAIVDFLDRECHRVGRLIDGVVRLESALVEAWHDRLESTMLARNTRRLRFWNVRVQLGPFGSALKSDEYVSGGVPLINPVHIHWSGLRSDADVSISEARAESLSQWRMRPGDVILARRGELGRAAVIRDRENGYFCGTGSAIVRHSHSLDPEFLVLNLLTRAVRDHLALAASGSTMPNLDTEALLDVELPSWVKDQQTTSVRKLLRDRRQVDSTAASVEQLKSVLGEYRDALITEAVTGQLDVTAVSDAQMDERLHEAVETATA